MEEVIEGGGGQGAGGKVAEEETEMFRNVLGNKIQNAACE